MEPAVCTDADPDVSGRRDAVRAAELVDALCAVDQCAVMAMVSAGARAELIEAAIRVAAHRRARLGAVCGYCGGLDHVSSECGMALVALRAVR